MLDIHIVEVVHDQSLQMFDLMSLTEMPAQQFGGPEVDMSVDILLDSTADTFSWLIVSFPHDHESPVDQKQD